MDKESASSIWTSKQSLGGSAVAKKYGSAYMSQLGKKGRRKQLRAKKSLASK